MSGSKVMGWGPSGLVRGSGCWFVAVGYFLYSLVATDEMMPLRTDLRPYWFHPPSALLKWFSPAMFPSMLSEP